MGKRAKKQAPQTSKFIVFNMYAYDVHISSTHQLHHFLSLYDVCMLSTTQKRNHNWLGALNVHFVQMVRWLCCFVILLFAIVPLLYCKSLMLLQLKVW